MILSKIRTYGLRRWYYIPQSDDQLRPHSFLMDVYTLSRMFGVFEENKLNRGPLKCRDPII